MKSWTVRELIQMLEGYNPNKEIYVDLEPGFTPIKGIVWGKGSGVLVIELDRPQKKKKGRE